MKRTPLDVGAKSRERGSTFTRAGRRYVVIECPDCGAMIDRRADADPAAPCKTCADRRQRRRLVIECKGCGKEFEVKASRISYGAKFCSHACATSTIQPSRGKEARRKNAAKKRGSKNPMWRGEDTEGSIERVFNVRLKGEQTCRNCGATGKLHLHHIVPRSMCKAGRRDLRNGVTLCVVCHMGWHHRRVVLSREILTAEEWEFVSSLQLLGQNIDAWLDERYPARGPERRAA